MHHQIKVHLAQGHFGIEIGADEQITELPITVVEGCSTYLLSYSQASDISNISDIPNKSNSPESAI